MKDVEQRTWEVVKRAFEERSPSRRSRAGNTVLLALLAGVITSVGFALKHRRRHAIVLVAVALLACAGYAMGQ